MARKIKRRWKRRTNPLWAGTKRLGVLCAESFAKTLGSGLATALLVGVGFWLRGYFQ